MIQFSPSLLAADPSALGQAALLCRDCRCDEIHFDVMDGHFVPNITFGPHILRGVAQAVPYRYDVHLMVEEPLLFVAPYADAGADNITVHAEAANVSLALLAIRGRHIGAGLSLRPKTPVEALEPYLPLLDRVLLMTVEPGFGGQKLIPEVLQKAPQLRRMGFTGIIQADGGIKEDNAPTLVQAGITNLIMGTGFFRSENPKALCQYIHSLEKA